jgi:hypothetical protein
MKIETSSLQGDYYIAELPEVPTVPHNNDPWFHESYTDIDQWCEETFGSQDFWGEEPVTGWKRMRNKYYFVDQSKLNWFVLRWE